MAQKYIIGDVVMYNNEIHTIIDILAYNEIKALIEKLEK